MNPLIKAALDDWRAMNASKDWWARFNAVMMGETLVVTLTYGVIHANGLKESELATATYFLKEDGKVDVIV